MGGAYEDCTTTSTSGSEKKLKEKQASGIPNYQNADRHHINTGTSSQQERERRCDVCGSELQERKESCPQPLACQRGLGVSTGADARLRGDQVAVASGGADMQVRGQKVAMVATWECEEQNWDEVETEEAMEMREKGGEAVVLAPATWIHEPGNKSPHQTTPRAPLPPWIHRASTNTKNQRNKAK